MIRLKREYGGRRPGAIVNTLGAGVEAELIRRGIAEPVAQPKSVKAPPRDKAMRAAPHEKSAR